MGCVWSSESAVVLSVPLYFCFTQLKTCPILCPLTFWELDSILVKSSKNKMSYNEESELMDLFRSVPCSLKGRFLSPKMEQQSTRIAGCSSLRGSSEDMLTFISSTGFLTQGLTTRCRMLSLAARIYDPLDPGSPYPVNQVRRIELHIFSDASQAACAACAYLRERIDFANSGSHLLEQQQNSSHVDQGSISLEAFRGKTCARNTGVVARLGGGLAVARQGKLTQRTAGQIEYWIEQVISPTRYSCYEFYATSHETAESQEIQVKEFGVKPNTAERVKEFVPFLDQDGFLRMCGQLRRSTLPPEFKHPVLQHNQLDVRDADQEPPRIGSSKPETRRRSESVHGQCRRVDAKPYQLKMERTNIVNPGDHLLDDSRVALAWIKEASARWKPFVSNQVQDIQESVSPQCWRYCLTKENPADIPSRGCPPGTLINTALWWHGPPCLMQSRENWPTEPVAKVDDNEHLTAERKTVKVLAGQIDGCGVEQVKESGIKPYSAERVREFKPFLDQDDLLRVGGRLRRSTLPPESKHSITLPHNHPVTELLIKDHPVRQMHAGINQTLVAIRTGFWIIRARNAIKKVIRSCPVCRRVDAQPYRLRMGDLPANRVTETLSFIHTGVDFAGPLFIRRDVQGHDARANKAYVCIFTCMTTRAVHQELLREQTTHSFLQGLRRFISRRGRPRVIQCDNFQSFKLADRFMQCLFRDSIWEKLQRKFIEERIRWKFITPRAPWCGGYWERLIRSIKNALRKTIRGALLKCDELHTVLCEIEVRINDGPLVLMGDDIGGEAA
ncbi:Uncharacterized protein T08_13947 [Trichinella sp. T8]|nr:Uncharacterized protein T08_13947 [Trichinella sp. T8]